MEWKVERKTRRDRERNYERMFIQACYQSGLSKKSYITGGAFWKFMILKIMISFLKIILFRIKQ